MNLSDHSDDDSSSSDSPAPAKRPRINTYRTSSTTSNGSVLAESDEDVAEVNIQNPLDAGLTQTYKYTEQNPTNLRLSRSSISEGCSSPNDQYDECRSSFDTYTENEEGSMRSRFLSNDSQYGSQESSFSNTVENPSSNGKYSKVSMNIMNAMGYRPGKGLGKNEHGRIEPVEASTQKGRKGLGSKPSTVGQIREDIKWTPDDEQAEAKEDVAWMPVSPNEPLTGDVLETWLKKGTKKKTIHDETNFVDPEILKGVLNSKTIFDTLDDDDLRKARTRSNPYETIGSAIFLNRAAVKMANLDATFDYMFTEPKKYDGSRALTNNEVLYFADICAGPGGFSEYVLYRKGWKAKGFGFTLKGSNDFKLSDFYAGGPETFNPYYGTADDGNIFNPANLSSLKDNVLKNTEDKGVHFLMADGGFSVAGEENIQEILSKQLYLCQCLAALMLVRTGGHFVVKLFDVFTMFSVGLVYIMYRCFDKVSIHKPVTSRPANSERYLVCLHKRLDTESVESHLYSVNSMLWTARENESDVVELVPLSVLKSDEAFFDYIYKSNCVLGEKQIKNLLKIAKFSKDKTLKEERQAAMKDECLKLWNLPDQVRTPPERLPPDEMLATIINMMNAASSESISSFKTNILNQPPTYIEKPSDLRKIRNIYDWYFMFLSSGKSSALSGDKSNSDLKIFLGCGGKQVHQLERTKWISVADLHVTLPRKTLIYGEIVKEYKGEGSHQMHTKAFHIIDALMLGGIDISQLTLSERINQVQLFCNALDKPFDSNAVPIRYKRLFEMQSFPLTIENLQYKDMKRVKRAITIDVPNRIDGTSKFFTVGSILFLKEIKEPWETHISREFKRKYYYKYDKKKPVSEYHIVVEARLDMIGAYTSRIMWPWDNEAAAIFESKSHSAVNRDAVEEYIKGFTERRK